MRKIAICCFLLLTLPFAARPLAHAQPASSTDNKASETAKSASTAHFYRLDFVVQELGENDKVVNSRSYSATISTDHKALASIRAGSRIPIPVSAGTFSTGSPATQFQYQDVGVNIDIDPSGTDEVGDRLALSLTIEVSSLASNTRMGGPNSPEEPVVRQNRWRGPILIPIGKPTVAFSSENLDSKGAMHVVVTATSLQ